MFLAGVGGCASPSTDTRTTANSAELAVFFEEVFERRLAQSPERQSNMGRKTDRLGEWDDRSDEFAAQQTEAVEVDLERLRSGFDRKS